MRLISLTSKSGLSFQRATTESIPHTPPYGFVKDDNGEWVIDPIAAENVRTIFRLFTEENYGCQMIANYLTAHKILSPSAYSGKIRKGSVTETNPFLMYIRRVKYNGSLILSYVCSGYTKKIQPCTAHYIREDVLQGRVFEVVARLMKKASEDFSDLKNSFLKKIRNGNAEREEKIEARYNEIIAKRNEPGTTLLNMYTDRNSRNMKDDVYYILSEQIARQSRKLEEEQNRTGSCPRAPI